MSVQTLWTDTAYIQDDFYAPDQQPKLERFVKEKFALFDLGPKNNLLKWDADTDEPNIHWWAMLVQTAFADYCEANDLAFEEYVLSDIQAHRTVAHSQQTAIELALSPHVDTSTGQFVVVYYVDLDPGDTERYTGGDLVVYKSMHPIDYPRNRTIIKVKKNRLVILPSDLVHMITPYFGKTPRLTLVTDIKREISKLEKKPIRTL